MHPQTQASGSQRNKIASKSRLCSFVGWISAEKLLCTGLSLIPATHSGNRTSAQKLPSDFHTEAMAHARTRINKTNVKCWEATNLKEYIPSTLPASTILFSGFLPFYLSGLFTFQFFQLSRLWMTFMSILARLHLSRLTIFGPTFDAKSR